MTIGRNTPYLHLTAREKMSLVMPVGYSGVLGYTAPGIICNRTGHLPEFP
jgi:hypothetical protein